MYLVQRPCHPVVKNSLQARHDAVEYTPRHDTGRHTAVKCKCVVVKINQRFFCYSINFRLG